MNFTEVKKYRRHIYHAFYVIQMIIVTFIRTWLSILH